MKKHDEIGVRMQHYNNQREKSLHTEHQKQPNTIKQIFVFVHVRDREKR